MEQANKILAISERLEKRLIKDVKSIQDEISRMVDELLFEFEIKNGKLVPESDAAFIIATLNKRIKEIIRDSQLEDEVMKYLDDFDLIDKNLKAIQSGINGIQIPQNIFNTQRTWIIDTTINSLLESNISTKFIQPVKSILYSRVAFGGTVVDAEKQLRALIKGDSKNLGVFERWVGQVARDALFEYQGAVNAQVKVEYELNALRYVGGLVEDSRCQCRRWVEDYNGILTDKILADEIAWAYRYGSGMKPDTNVQNFTQKRGGFNCTHLAIPTNSKIVQTVLGGTGCK